MPEHIAPRTVGPSIGPGAGSGAGQLPGYRAGHRALRIGLLTHSVNPRGGVVHTLELADALHARGHHVTVFAPATPGQRMFRATRFTVELVPVAQAATSVLEMVETRRAAFVGHLAQRLRNEPFEVLQPMIERFLAKDPQDRYQNAKEARLALRKAYRLFKTAAEVT